MSKQKRKLALALAVVLSVNLLLISLVTSAEAASYKKGSSGAVVTQIQTKLKAWGYYTGAVDGIFGSGTEQAVRKFQSANGLTVDGKVGTQTLAALGIQASTSSGGTTGGSSSADVNLLARLISAEARVFLFR